MSKRKLITGLVSAGVISVGFGATVMPASAEPRTVVVTLLGGQTITLTIDIPPGTPLDQIRLPGIQLPIVSITDATPPPAPAPVPPADAAPTPAPGDAPAPLPGPPSDPASKTGEIEEDAEKEATRQATEAATKAATEAAEKAVDRQAKAQGRKATKIRRVDGAPTELNPGFSLALPGAAPLGVPNFFIDKFRIPPFLLPIYQAAGIEYGVRWEVLAAINEIETDYGRNLNVSSAGALGWMQFIPSSWKAYGVDANRDGKKDPYNPVDAIFAAARYLKAAGADKDLRKAIFAYNHANWYVDSVLMRARLIGGLPADLVGSLTGLTQGHFPVHAKATYADDIREQDAQRRIAKGRNAAMPVESSATRRGVNIYAKPGSPVIAVQDGEIVGLGDHPRLGRYVMLRDTYGNTYAYGGLKKIATAHPVPKVEETSKEDVRKELGLKEKEPKDPKPSKPASGGVQDDEPAGKVRQAANGAAKAAAETAQEAKERLFANPANPDAFAAGGERQLLDSGDELSEDATFRTYFSEAYGLKRDDVVLKRLRVGSKVIAGTVLGRIGTVDKETAPHVVFEIRPAGKGSPRIDPKPVLDGWKLLESTAVYRAKGKNPFFGSEAKSPTIGQILLMSKETLQRRVLEDPRIEVYECGRRDIRGGLIDRRVLASLAFLSANGIKPSVSSLQCGRAGRLTSSGNVSQHVTGTAVDIAKLNGLPVLGNQGSGSVTEAAIRQLLTLQGTMKPDQIISLMTFDGADNTIALPDHADHLHVGWRPLLAEDGKLGSQLNAALKPSQWIKLIDRIGEIDNPVVPTEVSKYALDADEDDEKDSDG